MTLPLDDEALAPCPFCSGKAEIERRGTTRQSMIVACTFCGGRMESGDVVGLTSPAQWAWNRRVPPTQALEAQRVTEKAQTLLDALQRYGFPVSDAAVRALIDGGSIEAQRVHVAAIDLRAALHPTPSEGETM